MTDKTATAKLPSSPCTHCGKMMNDATSLDGDEDYRPEPGNVTLCIYCCNIMVYADDLTLRDPTAAEIETMKQTGEWAYVEHMQYKLVAAKVIVGAKWN